jgi:hypothetical protein
MRRREFTVLLSGAALTCPVGLRAQPFASIGEIGVLWHAGDANEESEYLGAFVDGIRELGYSEPQNIILENRFAAQRAQWCRYSPASRVLKIINTPILLADGIL